MRFCGRIEISYERQVKDASKLQEHVFLNSYDLIPEIYYPDMELKD